MSREQIIAFLQCLAGRGRVRLDLCCETGDTAGAAASRRACDVAQPEEPDR